MGREFHVRFREGPGVQFPRATRLVMCFQREQDASAMRKALAERLALFELELHPEKTRVLEFGSFAPERRECRGQRKPETFEFLGFVHYVGRSRRGRPLLHRRTSRKKRQAKLASLREECRIRRHHSVVEQHAWLCQVMMGHYRYYGVPTNTLAIAQFKREVEWVWHSSLQRRSQRARWSAARRNAFALKFPLPSPRVQHPWPWDRFAQRKALR